MRSHVWEVPRVGDTTGSQKPQVTNYAMMIRSNDLEFSFFLRQSSAVNLMLAHSACGLPGASCPLRGGTGDSWKEWSSR